jgi:Skp family chaperone for outer membrane proteins
MNHQLVTLNLAAREMAKAIDTSNKAPRCLLPVIPLLLIASPVLFAQKPTEFAVIDIQTALLNTRDGHKASEALQAKVLPRRTEFENRQHEIDTEAQRLQDDTTLAVDARTKLTEDLEAKRKELLREETDADEELQQEESKLIDKLSPILVKVLEKYAFEHQYAMIFDISDPHNPVLWASESVNLTKTITTLYDEAASNAQYTTPNTAKPRPPSGASSKPN